MNGHEKEAETGLFGTAEQREGTGLQCFEGLHEGLCGATPMGEKMGV